MKLSRRQALGLGAVGFAGISCAPIAKRFAADLPADLKLPDYDVEPTLKLVNRLTFGPTPGEVKRVATLGFSGYLGEQLAANQPEPHHLTAQLTRLDALRMDAHEMQELPMELVLSQLQQAAILRAAHSPNQLRERMVEFWSDHFNVYGRKGSAAFQKGPDETRVIREHALGNFGDLLDASAHSPAMLAYLDNQLNQKGVPNENYARELLELHTLGVHGGYTQQDVQEVARCFTGWTLENRFLHPKGKFRFDPERHDDGSKRVLGHLIPAGGGASDGKQVLAILASHQSTATFICRKLARFFLGLEDGPVVNSMSERFRATQGDIKSVLRVMFTDKNIQAARPVQKRPFDFMVSALRAVGAQTDGGRGIQTHLDKMGMPLYQWPMPDGYPVKTEAWTGTLLARWNFATSLSSGAIPGTGMDAKKLEERSGGELAEVVLNSRTLARRINDLNLTGQESIITACLASPEFQWR